MKTVILPQHEMFFQDRGFIAFDAVFSLKDMDRLSQTLLVLIQKKTKRRLENLNFLSIFMNGRDLFREAPEIFTLFQDRKILDIIYFLTNKTYSIRIAFDQFLMMQKKEELPNILPPNGSLDTLFSVQPLLMGALLCIQNNESKMENLTLFPPKPGSLLFFNPSLSFSLENLIQNNSGLYLLLGFSPLKACYVKNLQDPHNLLLKKYGLEYGDCLKEQTHPVLQTKIG